jgi:hypothetical protein
MEEPLWTQSFNCVSSERLPGAENWALFRDVGEAQTSVCLVKVQRKTKLPPPPLEPAGWAQGTHRRVASPLRRTRAARLSPPSGISMNTWWVFLFSYRNDRSPLRGGRRCPRVCCAPGSGESSHTRQASGGGACMHQLQ